MANPQARPWSHVKNVFALIIGIDNYKHATPLKGAVADANKFESFLRKQVNVQHGRIVNLRNEGATRAGIVKAFRSLWENKFIKYDDPIIIYFAGHGCKMRPPTSWEVGGHDYIQGIFPHDVQPQESTTRATFPIPDRTIATWLNTLSKVKGKNITVIFDCCHSAVGAPSPECVRAQEFHGSLPDDIDKEHVLHQTMRTVFLNKPSQYVVLVACDDTEYAREEHRRGKFTTVLLKALAERGADLFSFVELMKRLKHIDNQSPQCEGHLENRMIFGNVLKLDWGVFPVFRGRFDSGDELQKEPYRIEAGSIHGVHKSSLFDMYETAAIDTTSGEPGKPLCTLRVQEVFGFHTMATIQWHSGVTIGRTGFARLVRSGDALKVHFSTAFLAMVNQDEVLRDIHCRVEVAHDMESADFVVDIEDTNVVFISNLEAMTDHGFRRLPNIVPADPENVARVLFAASRWKQHIEPATPSQWSKDIEIDFFPLELVVDDMGLATRRGMGIPGMNNGANIVSLYVKPDNHDFYGMVIRNQTDLNFYPYLFIFNASTLDVDLWYGAPVGVHSNDSARLPLYKNSSLTIGYGAGSTTPFSFALPEGLGVDVSILKLYLTTRPMDLDWLQQRSPFHLRDLSFRYPQKKQMFLEVVQDQPHHQWGAISIQVVQHAHPLQ